MLMWMRRFAVPQSLSMHVMLIVWATTPKMSQLFGMDATISTTGMREGWSSQSWVQACTRDCSVIMKNAIKGIGHANEKVKSLTALASKCTLARH